MTDPNNPQNVPQQGGDPAGQPHSGGPQHGQPQYGQPQYGQPQYGAPTPGVPHPGAPGYGAPQNGAFPPQYGAPMPPAKKKRKWPWILGGLFVVLIIIIAATSGGGGDNGSDDTASSSQSDNGGKKDGGNKDGGKKTAGLNTPVRDGKFEFTVTGMQPGLESVGDNPYLTEQAQGQFVIVTMTVKNTSDQAQGFSPSDQKLFDAKGRSFESSTSAQIALGGSDVPVWDNINPGNSVEVKIVFDMPKDATPTSIEVHDSAFSDGVKVNLK